MSFAARLDGVELARVRFHLEFHDPFTFARPELLGLRREFLRAARWLQESGAAAAIDMQRLLDPPPPADPLLRRRVQKPSPPFALQWPEADAAQGDGGDELVLEFVLPGMAAPTAQALLQLLQRLGAAGFRRGEGHFEVRAVSACGHDGVWQTGWRSGEPVAGLSLPLLSLRWLVEGQEEAETGWRLQFITPARLLSHGRPLFAAGMPELAPFLLRRVTSVLASSAGLDPFDDADALLAALRAIRPLDNRLRWEDWRFLDGDGAAQELGGLVGALDLPAGIGEEERGVLQLAALFNVGRGASFGAGHFRFGELSAGG